MTLKEIFTNLATNLKNAGFKHVLLNNDQLEGKPLNFPFALVEFGTVNWQPLTDSTLECIGCKINVHLIFKVLSETDLSFFDTIGLAKVYLSDAGYWIDSETQDTNHDEYIDWVLTVSISDFVDDSTNQYRNLITIDKPVLELMQE
jgi:hypothetical protein